MSEPMKDAWNEVAEGFAKLGSVMRDRYHGGTDDAPGPAGTGTAADTGTAAGFERLREAFERLVEAGRDVGQRSVDVLRDADVNAQAKDAARFLNDALSATVDMIGNEVGQWFGRGETTSTTTSEFGAGRHRHRRGPRRGGSESRPADGRCRGGHRGKPVGRAGHRHRSADLIGISAIDWRAHARSSRWCPMLTL